MAFDDGGVSHRFPADVEAAVWFCCSEAVGNARKHAEGAPIAVRLAERPGALTFVVRDEGPGFATGHGESGGRGLRNMTTRLSAACILPEVVLLRPTEWLQPDEVRSPG